MAKLPYEYTLKIHVENVAEALAKLDQLSTVADVKIPSKAWGVLGEWLLWLAKRKPNNVDEVELLNSQLCACYRAAFGDGPEVPRDNPSWTRAYDAVLSVHKAAYEGDGIAAHLRERVGDLERALQQHQAAAAKALNAEVAEREMVQTRVAELKVEVEEYRSVDVEIAEIASAVIRDDAGVWDCVCSPNPVHDSSCPVVLRSEVESVAAQVVVMKRHAEKAEVRMAGLERRLSQYECPEHATPLYGECDECDKHNPDEEWRNPQL